MRVHLRVIVFIWNYHSGCWGQWKLYCVRGKFAVGPPMSAGDILLWADTFQQRLCVGRSGTGNSGSVTICH